MPYDAKRKEYIIMEMDELKRLPARARAAFAVMCFERFVRFVYAGIDFTPAAELMWHLVDGSRPADEAALSYLEIIPETLFAHKTYTEYKEQEQCSMSPEQYRTFTRLLNPDDWNLNSMMKHIYQIVSEFRK